MEIVKAAFKDIKTDKLGCVIMACNVDTQENRDGFVNGFTEFLGDEGVIPKGTTPEQAWESVSNTTTTGGRDDLVFVCKDVAMFNVPRWAMVRLKMQDCSWIDDWKDNYASHYTQDPIGSHFGSGGLLNFNLPPERDDD